KLSDLQRMASQIEEAGGDADWLDLQSLLPNIRNPSLHRGPRRDKVIWRLHANRGEGMHFSPIGQGATFSIRKKSNLLDGLLWVANNRFENFLKMVKHTTYRRRLVKISVILQLSAQALGTLNHSQLPLERSSWSHGRERCDYQLLHLDRLQERNLVEEIKLEYGVATGPTGRHHLVEY